MYHSSEQFIQHKKTELFEDEVTANKILNSRNPFEVKKLSKMIRNFEMDKGRKHAQGIAVYHKFSQNECLLKMLKSTKSMKLVEASRDRFWGTGVHLGSDQALNELFYSLQFYFYVYTDTKKLQVLHF